MGSPEEDLANRVRRAASDRIGSLAEPSNEFGMDCFVLVDKILRGLKNAKTAADFAPGGRVTRDGDYVWGEEVELKDVKPGYILQFKNHKITEETLTLGEYTWKTTLIEGPRVRPHHTAVIIEVLLDGGVTVVEQNVKPTPQKVRLDTILRLEEGEEMRPISNMKKLKITVNGTVKAYRPVPK